MWRIAVLFGIGNTCTVIRYSFSCNLPNNEWYSSKVHSENPIYETFHLVAVFDGHMDSTTRIFKFFVKAEHFSGNITKWERSKKGLNK